ncbi:MAG TPA: ABC transporter permease [Gemmatimonadaceae bacterium]|nr:ABC transporter permease [Gemmatimonadaceae bacterium]
MLKRIGLWVRSLLRPGAVERQLDEEIRFHLQSETEANLGRGLAPAEARHRAIADFGGVDRVKEAHRDGRGTRWLADAAADVRYALRQLRKAPTFTTAVVATLALALGANAVLFSLVNGVVLHPVSGVHEPERLFELGDVVSHPALLELRRGVTTASLAGISERRMALGRGSAAEHVTGALVSGDFFQVIGVGAALGRVLSDLDDAPGAPPVAVLTHDHWRRGFGGDSTVLGQTIAVNGASLTVVGVVAPGFRTLHLGTAPAVWIPLGTWPAIAPSSMRSLSFDSPNWQWISVVGRLAPNATFAQAQEAITSSLAAAMPDWRHEDILRMSTPRPAQSAALPAQARSGVVRFIAVLGAVVALVLLTACANITGLFLSRAAYREREIAARVALGASRWRLVRQFLTETVVLAAAGGVAGLLLFGAAAKALSRLTLPGGIAGGALGLTVDARLVSFAALATLATGVLVGLAPALRASRPDTINALKGLASSRGSRLHTLRNALVTAQVAVGLALLVGTGLFVRALQHAVALDLGFSPEQLVTLAVDPGLVQLDPVQARSYYTAVLTRVSSEPGVSGATWAGSPPLTVDFDRQSATIEGYVPGPGERVMVEYIAVGPRFHEILGIPMAQGRGFDDQDRAGARPVVIVNETLAKRYFAGRDALGAQIEMSGARLTIVGVARDTKYHELGEAPRPYAYFPLLQAPEGASVGSPTLVVRASGGGTALLPSIVAAARRADPKVPVYGAMTMSDRLRASLAPQRAGAALFGAFSALALLVAAVGVYGVVAYSVSERTREIGIRIALGARAVPVLRLVLARTLWFVALGLPFGIAVSVAVGRASTRFLYGVSATDALTLATMSGLMFGVAALAAYVPARRAVRVDPLLALRADA